MSRTKIVEREEERQLSIKLGVSLLERLEKHAKRMQDKTYGLTVSRVEAIRALLNEALEKHEGAESTSGAR